MNLDARALRRRSSGPARTRLVVLTRDLELDDQAADVDRLIRLASAFSLTLPSDHLDFMRHSDGAEGEVGETWLEFWPVAEIEDSAQGEPRYEQVLLFAGNGANTIYGFDLRRDGEIVEGDWIGLDRDELISHGRTLLALLESLAQHDPRGA